ncbi:MAG: hypothetical protein ACODAJ_04355 [Planctomycetota bacterium]
MHVVKDDTVPGPGRARLLLRPGGLILAHNINPRQADARYIKAITTNPKLETVLTQMHTAGISVTLKKR